jgi:hypothetical protein
LWAFPHEVVRRGVRGLSATTFAAILALWGCDGVIFEPERQIDRFEAEADARQALVVLRRLAERHGLELKGGFYLPR